MDHTGSYGQQTVSFDTYIKQMIETGKLHTTLFIDNSTDKYLYVNSFSIAINKLDDLQYKIHICYQEEMNQSHDVYNGYCIYDSQSNTYNFQRLFAKYDNFDISLEDAIEEFFVSIK